MDMETRDRLKSGRGNATLVSDSVYAGGWRMRGGPGGWLSRRPDSWEDEPDNEPVTGSAGPTPMMRRSDPCSG